MTKEREEHLRWKSQQDGQHLLKEVFALVDELRSGTPRENLCTRDPQRLRQTSSCQFTEGHASGYSYDRMEP